MILRRKASGTCGDECSFRIATWRHSHMFAVCSIGNCRGFPNDRKTTNESKEISCPYLLHLFKMLTRAQQSTNSVLGKWVNKHNSETAEDSRMTYRPQNNQ